MAKLSSERETDPQRCPFPRHPRSTHGQNTPARGRPRRRHRADPPRHRRTRHRGRRGARGRHRRPPGQPRRTDHVRRVVPLPGLAPGHPRRHPRRSGRPPGPDAGPAGRHHRLHRPAHRRHPLLGVRHLDLAGHRDRLRRDRTGRLLEREDPRRHLDPGGTPGPLQHRRHDPLVRDGALASGDADIKRTTVNRQGDPGRRSGRTRSASTTRPSGCCCGRTSRG